MERLLSSPIGYEFSKVEKKILKHAFKFYNIMQTLLAKTFVDKEGRVVIVTSEAFSLYEKVVAKHKMKISFFRIGEENYSLFFTAPDKNEISEI